MRGELFQAVFCPGSSCFELTLGHASDLPGPPPLPSTPCTSSTCACPGLRGMQMGGRMVCAANRSRSCVPGRACAGAVCVECVDMWIWAHVRLCARTCAPARVGRCRQRLCTHARTHSARTHAGLHAQVCAYLYLQQRELRLLGHGANAELRCRGALGRVLERRWLLLLLQVEVVHIHCLIQWFNGSMVLADHPSPITKDSGTPPPAPLAVAQILSLTQPRAGHAPAMDPAVTASQGGARPGGRAGREGAARPVLRQPLHGGRAALLLPPPPLLHCCPPPPPCPHHLRYLLTAP